MLTSNSPTPHRCPKCLWEKILHGAMGLGRVAVAVLAGLLVSQPGMATDIYEEGELIVSLTPGAVIEDVNAQWGTVTIDSYAPAGLYLLFAEGVGDIEILAEQMELDPLIAEAEANYRQDTPEGIRQIVFVAVGGTIADFEDQGLTERIGLDEAHVYARGAGVTVAVIDTGIDLAHPLFAGRIAPGGYDFVDDDADPSETANGMDDDGDWMVDESFGHGTMVASIITLVAPDAMILPIRGLDDDGRGDAWQLVKATRYAVDQGADVINMSFGVPRTISPIGHQIEYATTNGVVVVAGGGNENRDHPVYYPADDSDTIMVTALDSVDVKADFADYNSDVVVSAPGTGVRSAFPGGGWALGSGCSFAAPFVSGEAALILSQHAWPPDLVEDRIENAVDPIYHIPGNEEFEGELGTGRIYLPAAVDQTAALDVVAPVPPTVDLLRAFPNPARLSTSLQVDWATDGARVELTIFDVSGRRVAGLLRTGPGALTWDGRADDGARVAPGVYFFAAEADGHRRRGSLHLIR